jgi:hypothetical protein
MSGVAMTFRFLPFVAIILMQGGAGNFKMSLDK